MKTNESLAERMAVSPRAFTLFVVLLCAIISTGSQAWDLGDPGAERLPFDDHSHPPVKHLENALLQIAVSRRPHSAVQFP